MHDRIEQGLKDKIHQLQQEHYQSNRAKVQQLQDEEGLAARLQDMAEALHELERKFEREARETQRLRGENEALTRELAKCEQRRQAATLQAQEQALIVGAMEQDVRDLHADLKAVAIDCQFYKEKYVQMQTVVDGCAA